MTEMLWKYRHAMGIGLVIIMHAVGLTSILLDPESPLLPLTPVNLWLCGSVAVLLHVLEARKDLIWMLAVYRLVLELNAGGEHRLAIWHLHILQFRRSGLGYTLGHWHELVASGLGQRHVPQALDQSRMLLALGTGVVMVGIDALIEPLAPALRFWAFEQHPVPAANYVSWWVLGTIAGACWRVPNPCLIPPRWSCLACKWYSLLHCCFSLPPDLLIFLI